MKLLFLLSLILAAPLTSCKTVDGKRVYNGPTFSVSAGAFGATIEFKVWGAADAVASATTQAVGGALK